MSRCTAPRRAASCRAERRVLPARGPGIVRAASAQQCAASLVADLPPRYILTAVMMWLPTSSSMVSMDVFFRQDRPHQATKPGGGVTDPPLAGDGEQGFPRLRGQAIPNLGCHARRRRRHFAGPPAGLSRPRPVAIPGMLVHGTVFGSRLFKLGAAGASLGFTLRECVGHFAQESCSSSSQPVPVRAIPPRPALCAAREAPDASARHRGSPELVVHDRVDEAADLLGDVGEGQDRSTFMANDPNGTVTHSRICQARCAASVGLTRSRGSRARRRRAQCR